MVGESEIQAKGGNNVISGSIRKFYLWFEVTGKRICFLFGIFVDTEFSYGHSLGIKALRRSLVTGWDSRWIWLSDSVDHALQYVEIVHLRVPEVGVNECQIVVLGRLVAGVMSRKGC